MKKILFSQRVEIIPSYGERRDCADQSISRLILECGYMPIPMINKPDAVKLIYDEIAPDGVLLTGGNDLANYGGDAPERDSTEKKMIEYAEKNAIPLLGICRGLQIIADYYGAKLEKVEGHIRVEHSISGILNRSSVNSYHGMGVKTINPPLEALSRTEDGVIEALRHSEFKIAGIMWHPEREKVFSSDDIQMIKEFYEEGRLV